MAGNETINREQALGMARWVAGKNYGQPYKWGGDDTIDGFDCSGFVQEILYSVGALKDGLDRTAQGLWDHYSEVHMETPYRGCLVFWQVSKTNTHIRHIEFCINEYYSIGASGGGSKTTDKGKAALHNAFVKVRPIKGRGIIAGYVDPFTKSAPWGK